MQCSFAYENARLLPSTLATATMPTTISPSDVIDTFRQRVGEQFAGRDAAFYFLPEDPFHEDEPGTATLNFVAVFEEKHSSDTVELRTVADELNAEYGFDPYLHVRTSGPEGRYARAARENGVRL